MEYSINSVFCNIGKAIGPDQDPETRQAVRLLLGSAAGDAGQRALRERPLRQGRLFFRPRTAKSTPAGSPSGRSGCWSRPCRWPWSPPRSRTAGRHEAVPRRADRGPGRQDVVRQRPEELRARPSSPTSSRDCRMMERVVCGGTATAGADLRADGRQDRNRGDRELGAQHDLVHRLRAGREPTGRRRRRARATERHRRDGAPIARQIMQALG